VSSTSLPSFVVVIFAGAVETVHWPAGWTAGPTGVALPTDG
jgi:hypothetical protein